MPDNNVDDDLSGGRSRGLIPDDELPFGRTPIKWKLWLPVLFAIACLVTAYFVVEARKSRRERDALLREHAVLTESLAPPYRAVRAKIERLTSSVIGPWQGTYTADGFSMETLARTPVLYGRVRLGEVHGVTDVERSIRHRYPDQIAQCMGLETNLVHEFYRKGEFLMPAYVDGVRAQDSGARLRALREDLQFRLRRDTPDLVEWSRRRYFVLAVDEAAVSTDGPSRLYVWDLASEQLVFRARAEGDTTVIIPVRIAGMPGGGRPVPQPTGHWTQTQHDCAIANVARQQLGVQTMAMPSAPDVAHETPAAGGDAGTSVVGGPDGGAAALAVTPDAGAAAAHDATSTPPAHH